MAVYTHTNKIKCNKIVYLTFLFTVKYPEWKLKKASVKVMSFEKNTLMILSKNVHYFIY